MNEPATVQVAQVDGRPPRQAALYWLALGAFAIGTEGFMIAAILPNIAADLVVSVALAASMISIFALAYALSSPILTALTGRVDRRKLLLAAMTIFSLANVVAASTHTYWGLAVARVLLACAAGLYTPNANALAGALDLFPVSADRQLAEELTAALLKAEGVANPGPTHTNNTGAFIHRMPPSTVNTAAQGAARTVRVQVVTPPGVLSRAGQKQLVAEATEIVARISGDPTQAGRTWVLLTEAAEGGWGIAGTAFWKEEFAALAAKKK